LLLLNALANAPVAKTPAEACAQAADHLARAAADVPFALLYLLDEAGAVARLVGAANIEPGGPLAPRSIESGDHTVWPFDAERMDAPRFVALEAAPGGARGAVILAIERAGGGRPLGFIVAGTSPLLRSSPSYVRFHNLLAASLSQGVSNAAAYDAERQRAESLAKLDRAKTLFFTNVSHELRTPLTLMLTPIQDMVAMADGAVVDRPTVALIHRNSLRLLKLVNTLLEFSRIEAGRVDAVYEPADLAALTADLASSFRSAIERVGLAFVVDCPPLGEPIYVDRDMWEKIVLNLLSNALKFTFEGTIAIQLALDGGSACLRVVDTGTGIADADRARLFERFHRIDGARSRSQEGSGIGLALVQELVRLHRGDVQVTSALGVGSAFEVRIPRGAAHLDAERIHAARTRPSTALRAETYVDEALRWDAATDADPAPRIQRSRDRIVFADDNADMREYVGRLLGERWEVEAVGDGAAALERIQQAPPALVLCDVMMPRLDGFALVRAMRADPALRAIPIIILSARAGEDETTAGLGAGANDYIAKPFSARELLVRIASQLSAARVAREMAERERVQRENLYRHFMQAPFPVAVLRGPEHVLDLANPQILRAWSAGPEVVGHALGSAFPEFRDPFIGLLDDVFRTGVPYEGTSRPVQLPTGPDGALEDHHFNFVYAALRDAAGAIEGILISAFDVSDQLRARSLSERAVAAAEAARATQRAASEFQERFVAVLGHDLRNPLGAIAMAAGVLKQQQLVSSSPVAARIVGRIDSSAARMSRMIEQILDLSRSRVGGGIQVTPAPMDLRAMLVAVVDELQTAHPSRTLQLRCDAATGLWDRDRLEQVFSNLVGNALHHGAAEAPISLVAHVSDDAIRVDVHNHGPAIPDDVRAILFDAFRRGNDDRRTAKAAGLGLGLYISREIVAAHGGRIDVRSTAADGTTFSVELPRAR
jgi:signal transduction histidine kinase/CheY-like chemotaxis protein